jgi:hypothetical protein
LARYAAPEAYSGPSPVAQPSFDPTKPHLHYPEEVYKMILARPDSDIAAAGKWAKPPVDAQGAESNAG